MYDVLGFAVRSVREALEAAAELAVARGQSRPDAAVGEDAVVAAFESERRLWAPGLEGVSGFAELLRFMQTADGWIRTHANYVHHRAALLRVLGERDPVRARLGLSGDELAERHPHLTVVQLSAWGTRGPWGERRGFDSLVQAATGIADGLRGEDGAPGALPVQALDHATGYRIAAAALRGLARCARGEGAEHAELSLARTAADLMRLRGQSPESQWPQVEGPLLEVLPDGRRVVPPPGSLDGRPLSFTRTATFRCVAA